MRDMEVHRQLGGDGGDDEVIPGQGWTKTYFGDSVNNGYCDGTSTSMCGRSEQSDCLMYGHNDGHGGKNDFVFEMKSKLSLVHITNIEFL